MIIRIIYILLWLFLPVTVFCFPADSLIMALEVSEESSGDDFPIATVIPKSPQTSALECYGYYPVGHATGVPEISIPIHDIRIGGYTLPVTLSYHASGIKADEVASAVGLGWSLDAGGVITRTICGAPDFSGAGNEYCDYSRLRSLVCGVPSGTGIERLNSVLFGSGRSDNGMNYDTCSDRYVFNFAGKSGVFRMSYVGGGFIQSPHSMADITENGSGQNSSFTITDTDGTVYTFDQPEYAGVKSEENTTDISSWYLTGISTPYGDITLKYVYGKDYTLGTYSEYVTTGTFGSYVVDGYSVNDSFRDESRYCSTNVPFLFKTPILSEISWDGNKIRFFYAEDREDPWPTRLVRIEVINSEGDLFRTVELDNLHFWGNGSRNLRMMLEGLTISGLGRYSFVYDTSRGSLPDYLFTECSATSTTLGLIPCHTDYWGYYNGRTAPCSISREAYSLVLSRYVLSNGAGYSIDKFADRSPDDRYSRLGTLREITYPTGGRTSFDFEGNGNGDLGGLRVRSISDYDINGTLIGRKTYSYLECRLTGDHPDETMVYPTFHTTDLCGTGENTVYPQSDLTCIGTPTFPISSSCPCFYSYVRETDMTGDYTDYRYVSVPDIASLCGHVTAGSLPLMVYSSLNDFGSIRPLLSERKVFGSSGTLLLSEKFTYATDNVRSANVGNKLVSLVKHTSIMNKGFSSEIKYNRAVTFGGSVVMDSVMFHSLGCRLTGKTVTDHTTGVATTESYTYDEEFRTTLPRSVTVTNSDGRVHRTEYRYTFDGESPIHTVMSGKYNMYDFVTDTKHYCDGTLLESVKTDYILHNDWFYPGLISRSEMSGDYYELYRHVSYGSKGNILTLITNVCDTANIGWGYGETYPVSLRNNGRLMNSYTWRPLFGVASIKLENGYNTDYSYDNGGRLASVSDAYGILSRHYYSYCNDGSSAGGDNSVHTVTYLSSDGSRTTDTRRYYDSLGRPVLDAANGINTSGCYVYTLREYDGKGRDSVAWLPVCGGTTPDVLNVSSVSSLSQAAYGGDSHTYSVSTYDGLDRCIFRTTSGDEWSDSGRGCATTYVTNAASGVKLYRAPMESTSLVKDGYYAAGTLHGKQTSDEDGRSLTVFTDRLGRKILERRDDNNDTYFVYDDLGRLRYVLSPEYQNAGYKAEYGYEYRYDSRGNVVKKILPGCEYIQYWYDRSNRLTFMQDGTLRSRGLYRFYIYDTLGRIAVQGTCTACNRRETVNRAVFTPSAPGFCGTGYAVPHSGYIVNPVIENVTYYDSHDFIGLYSGLISGSSSVLTVTSSVNSTGLQTGSFMYASNGEPLITVFYHDGKGRITDTRRISLSGRFTSEHTSYTYSGDVASLTHGEKSSSGVPILSASLSYGYSQLGELPVTTDLSIGTAGTSFSDRRISTLTYDGFGRIASNTRSGSAGSVSFDYDLHGWITGVTGPGFTENLYYAGGVGAPCYNGNVSSMTWSTPDYWRIRGYCFSYDGLNRMAHASYGEHESMDTNTGRYDEKVLEYTANGGIRRFQRRGLKDDGVYGKIDNLRIDFDGNRLKKVTDDALPLYRNGASDFHDSADLPIEYTYNNVGALTSDANRGISNIEYDNLNHPVHVTFTNGNTIKYVYAPDGTKLRTIWLTAVDNIIVPVGHDMELSADQILSADSVDYSGASIYYNGIPDKFLFDGGYCSFDGNTPVFHYYTKDLQGNNRAVVSENGTVEQITHYYPFGGVMTDISTNSSFQSYKYNGKELDRTHGWDKYDYGARQYDPILNVWTSADPLCENYYHISPYAYCLDNPVKFVDPDGRSVWTKMLKGGYRMAKAVRKKGFSALTQADTYYDIVSDITENANTLLSDEASTEEKVIAGASLASEFLPVSIGDVKDGVKIVNAVHGNSKASTRAQHAYDIRDKINGKIVKTGVSSGKIRKDGKSYRAESQVRKWNRQEGEDRYESYITYEIPEGKNARDKIYKYEKDRANTLREQGQLPYSKKHQIP